MVALPVTAQQIWEFGEFAVDGDRRLLLRNGDPVLIGPKAFDLLLVFLRQPDRVLSKQELLDAVWPDTAVDINNLNQQVAALRKALDDGEHGWIETVPRVGFRFCADVQQRRLPVASRLEVRRLFVIAGVVAALAVISIGSMLFEKRMTQKPQHVSSIAVLPLRNESSNPEDAYLGFAVADALIHRLTQSKQVSTRPSSAIRRYLDRDIEPQAAGRELQVDAVVVGTIARSRDAIELNVRLVRVADGTRMWSRTFSSEPAHLFEFPDEIYHALSAEIGLQQIDAPKKAYRPSPAAYEAYSQGMYHWNRRTNADFEKAEA